MQGIQIQTQDIHDSVTHRKVGTSDPFWTLDFGEPLNCTHLFFCETEQVDAVIAELVAIRAEMTGETDDTYRLTAKGEAALDAEPAKCLDKYDHLGNTDYCQSGKGHDGQHEGHMGRRWTPEPTIQEREAETLGWCPGVTVLDDESLYCDRPAGHFGSHHAPGPDEGSEVAWSDEPASVTA